MIENDQVAYSRTEQRLTGDEPVKARLTELEPVAKITRTVAQPVLREPIVTQPVADAPAVGSASDGAGVTFNAPPPPDSVTTAASVAPVPSPPASVTAPEDAPGVPWAAIWRNVWPWLLILAVAYLVDRAIESEGGGSQNWT